MKTTKYLLVQLIIERETEEMETHNQNYKQLLFSDINPFNGGQFSRKYKDLLEVRKKLPVFDYLDELHATILNNKTVIIEGETGSGKTTQIPQSILLQYLNVLKESGQRICCTQPRRVAAMSVAARVADELDISLGDEVGYTIRFEDKTSPNTMLTYMTDGMLLREAMIDPILSKYRFIILDEAHERTVATDVLMGLLKVLLVKRDDLNVLVMSATIDIKGFQKYFLHSPLIKIPGRTFPVEIYYLKEPTRDYIDATITTITQIHLLEPPGDILVFLTGEEEILDVCNKLEDEICNFQEGVPTLHPIPLFSTLPTNQQQLIFKPAPVIKGVLGRKVIVATNIAETSLTIDGIVYVVDPGFSKQKVYNPRVRVESLLVSNISKSSAQQRAGRAGRTRPGKCFRLYSEESFYTELIEQTFPEILRSNIADVVLTLKKLGIDDLVHFDFMDPPAPETLMRALEQLYYLGALSDEGDLTKIGRLMSELPLDPVLASVLINSAQYNCIDQMLTIVSMLSVPHPFIKPKNKSLMSEFNSAISIFSHSDSDHITLLNVYDAYISNKEDNQWCYDNYVQYRSLRQAKNVRNQLERLCVKHGIMPRGHAYAFDNSTFTNIKKSLISGFFMQVGHCDRSGKGSFITVKDNQIARIHPSSVIRYNPEWVVYNEFVLTQTNYIRTCTAVEPEWLIEISPKYYDMSTFNPNTDVYRDLSRVYAKLKGPGASQ